MVYVSPDDENFAILIDNHCVRRPLRERLGALLDALSRRADQRDDHREWLVCMRIAARGSSAVRQVRVFNAALRAGRSHGQGPKTVGHAILEEDLYAQALAA